MICCYYKFLQQAEQQQKKEELERRLHDVQSKLGNDASKTGDKKKGSKNTKSEHNTSMERLRIVFIRYIKPVCARFKTSLLNRLHLDKYCSDR